MIRLLKLAALCSVFALVTMLAASAWAAKDDTTLISRQSAADGGLGGDNDSLSPDVSADGRYVAFASNADNLSDEDDDNYWDVFVRDTQTNTTTLVSRADGVAGAAASDSSFTSSISDDGRYVAFVSQADNLGTADTDTDGDVFVRDLQADTTTLVSRATGATGDPADDSARAPSISGDGRYVAFDSLANNLATGEDQTVDNVFVRDTLTNTTTFVSQSSTGDSGDSNSVNPAISGNGRYVAFESSADNLGGGAGSTGDIFVRDLQTDTTTLVSRAPGATGAAGDASSETPSISDDGRHVAFSSFAGNFGADGETAYDIFVRDLQASTTTLASRADGPTGAVAAEFGHSYDPSISGDGRYVAFSSDDDGFSDVDNDVNLFRSDVFVRDLQVGTTKLVSRASGPDGAGGNMGGDGGLPGVNIQAISADGRFVVFDSPATNLSDASDDTAANIFMRDVLGPPPVPPAGPVGSSSGADQGAPIANDSRAPALSSSVGKSSLAGGLVVFVSCDEACAVTASGTVSVPGASKSFRLKALKRSLGAGTKTKLVLKLPKKAIKGAKRAIRKRKKVQATVSLGATDAAGNSGKTTRKIRLVK